MGFTEADLARLTAKPGVNVISDSRRRVRTPEVRAAVLSGFRNEEAFQQAVARYMDAVGVRYGERWLWTHVGNERKGDKARSRMGSFGTSPGVPDVMLFMPSSGHDEAGALVRWSGLAVELKHDGVHPDGPRLGDLTRDQQRWLAGLQLDGWAVDVCWTMPQFEAALDNYLNDPSSFLGGY